MRPVIAAAVLGAAALVLAVSSCAPAEPTAELTPQHALTLGKALASSDLATLGQWTRRDRPVALRRECTDCPPHARWRHDSIWTPDRWSVIAPEPVRVGYTEPDATVSCEGRCCAWSLGLLDHATVYLRRACFEHDDAGWFVVALEIVDG